MGHTAMERKFCGLSGDGFRNCEKYSYEAKLAVFWQVAEMANANLKSSFKFRGCLRPLWPLKSYISYLLSKYENLEATVASNNLEI